MSSARDEQYMVNFNCSSIQLAPAKIGHARHSGHGTNAAAFKEID